MLQNYSKLSTTSIDDPDKVSGKYNWWMLVIIPSWVIASFIMAQILVMGLMWLLNVFNFPFELFNQTILSTSLAALIYIISLATVIALPWLIKKIKTSWSDIGLNRLPQWSDILLTPAGLIIYLVFSTLLILLATRLLPWFDVNQAQDVGFGKLSQRYEYVLAFTTLVVIAPIAEEILFRGYLYGKLKKFVPVWAAILATSLIFGTIHSAWNLAIDTFALSVVLCILRELTGSIWASILLHMVKNGIAFYVLFIYPSLLTAVLK